MHLPWKCHLSRRTISSVVWRSCRIGAVPNLSKKPAINCLYKFTPTSLFNDLVHNKQRAFSTMHLQSRLISISSRYHLPKANASEITSILEEKILKNTPNLDLNSTGKVLSVGDGIARIYGLKDVQAEEMVTFSSGIQVLYLIPSSYLVGNGAELGG